VGWTIKAAMGLLPYLYFEHLVFSRFQRDLRNGEYTLVHRLTPVSPVFPSPIATWARIPFVLGPLNGGLPWPPGTTGRRWAEMEPLSYLRGAYHLLPYVRATYVRSAAVLGGSRNTLLNLPRSVRSRALYMPENGVDPKAFFAHDRLPPSRIRPLRALFVGRLVPLKGVDLPIRAMASSPILREHAELRIVGDGPQREVLAALAQRCGVADRVHFVGQVPHNELAREYRSASVFVFPSMKEFGGGVVLEALACGLPAIVLDYGGPAEYVPDTCGFRLPLSAGDRLVDSLRHVLERVCQNPEVLDTMSTSCSAHARGFEWDSKARRVVEVYEHLLSGHSGRIPLSEPCRNPV
jgi:glycosyltransferase involved in cell wall biosynthesis